ncbi:DUF1850 domain-containing protein [Chryseomicrobium palamuruense]|uniref:DUF1850 domain-containing protein n=1 Tax=Chryseomicrobium palamuruense TaxID=682973 RepID=A0ABV8UST7_9BACL
MTSNKKRKWGVAIATLFLFCIPVKGIQVSSEQYTHFYPSNEVELRWIHSVEKEEWKEFYRIHHHELLLYETAFKTFGAGVPSDGEVIPSDDGLVHFKMNQSFPELRLFVSDSIETTMFFSGQEVPIYKYVDDYVDIVIRVTYYPWWLIHT